MTLLFAIVIAVSVTVVVVGGQALEDRQQATSMEGASTSFQRLDADLAQVASGSQQQVSVPDLGDGTATVQGDRGRVRVNVSDGSNTCPVVNATLGRVVYESGDRTLAYQGGGVFERTAGTSESAVISAPPVQYKDSNGAPTLSLPIVLVNGSTTGDASFQRVGKAEQFPNGDCDIENPIPEDATIEVTVESEFYRAWETVIERQGIDADADDGEVNFSIEGGGSSGSSGLRSGLISTGSNEVNLRPQFKVDSYDSGNGTYENQSSGNATAFVDTDVTVSADATINGSLRSTGDVHLNDSAEVNGTIYHNGSFTNGSSTEFEDTVSPVPSTPSVENRDDTIDENVSDFTNANDNDDDPATNDTIERLKGNAGTDCENNECKLGPGDYYVRDFSIPSRGTLTLDPNGGDIEIAAPDGLELKANSTIEIVSDGQVTVYSAGDTRIKSRSNVTNADDDATRFRLWQRSNTTTKLKSQSTFVGVLHAGPTGQISMHSNQDGEIYGSVIGDVELAESGRPIHYDRALDDAGTIDDDDNSTADGVVYFHTSTTTVESQD
nr:hypothetical protein [Halomicrobium salinisoli]